MPPLEDWFNLTNLITAIVYLFGTVVALIGIKPLVDDAKYKKILLVGYVLAFLGLYVSAEQTQDNGELKKQAKEDHEILLSIQRIDIKKNTASQTKVTAKRETLQDAIDKFNVLEAFGEQVLRECSSNAVDFKTYSDDRQEWLDKVRYFLSTDPLLNGNERWKNWSGYGDSRGEGFENRDFYEGRSPAPSTSPADRNGDYSDLERRLANVQFYIGVLKNSQLENIFPQK